MIAAAIVCAAVIGQAADAKWSISATKVYDGTDSTADTALYSGTAYIFNAGEYSQAAVYATILAGEAISGYAGTATVADGTLPSTVITWGQQGGDKQDWYFVLVEDDKTYFSNIKNIASPTTDTAKNVLIGSQNNGTATFSATAPTGTDFAGAGKWSTVPEPTSGLLLLLGVAGLALRRRRA